MILVTKQERLALEKAGILQEKKKLKGGGFTDPNFVVVNKFHKGRTKHTYVIENRATLSFLGKWELMPYLQKITKEQYDLLIETGVVKFNEVQNPGEYVPDALIFIAKDGTIRVVKETTIMKSIGIWR